MTNTPTQPTGRDEVPSAKELFPEGTAKPNGARRSNGAGRPQVKEAANSTVSAAAMAVAIESTPASPGNGQGAETKQYTPPADAADIAGLFQDTGQGDPLAEISIHTIPIDKPKDFFRLHPDPAYRRRCLVYTHKIEGQIEETHYIVPNTMSDEVSEARPCILATCIYRDGSVRLWPLKMPREGEKDQKAWETARAAAKKALTTWTKLLWKGGKYDTRDAKPGYAPDPDVSKIPSFEKLVALATGEHGVFHEKHPVYLDHVVGEASTKADDDSDL
jgi:hypothetical protein